MRETAALILAAGAASRFGALKQLADIDGKPMLQHCIDSASKVLPGAVYTVLGNQWQEIANEISGANMLVNPNWHEGIGNSIAFGVSQLAESYQAILILLADQPKVSSQHIGELLFLFQDNDCACSFYRGSRGVPAVFDKRYFGALCNLSGDRGAKSLLQTITENVAELTLPAAAFDVDKPEDLDTQLFNP